MNYIWKYIDKVDKNIDELDIIHIEIDKKKHIDELIIIETHWWILDMILDIRWIRYRNIDELDIKTLFN